MVEQESHGVREDFAQQPIGEVPEVARPHSLHGVTPGELRKNGVYSVAKTAQQRAAFGSGISFLGRVGGQKLYAHATHQLLLGLWRMVVAIPNEHPRGSLGDLRQHRKLVGVGRGHRKTSDHPRPTDPHVHSEAVEGLFEESVFAEGGLSLKTRAAVGSGEQARWQGERVRQGEGGVVGSVGQELLPEEFLDLPQVGRLPGEGTAMNLAECREPLGVVPSEEEVDALVGVYPQKLSDDLDGEDLGVRKLWGGAALTDTPSFELIVYQAEDGDDEGAKIHEGRPPLRRLVWSLPSVGRSSLSFKPSRKLAHGVK